MRRRDETVKPKYLPRDRDTKFVKEFDAIQQHDFLPHYGLGNTEFSRKTGDRPSRGQYNSEVIRECMLVLCPRNEP